MNATARRVGAGLTVAAMLGCVVPAVVIPIVHGELLGLFGPDLGAGIAFSLVGAFLLVRGAVTNLAVIMCVQGVGAALTTILGVWRELAAQAGPLHGAALWAGWFDNISWLPGVVLLTPLVLLFPDGRLAGPRWRWPIVISAALAVVFVVMSMVLRQSLVDGKPYVFAPNPTGFIDDSPALDTAGSIGFLGLLVTMFVSLGSLIARRRHATGVQRAQLTSLLYGGAITIAMIAALNPRPETDPLVFALGVPAVAPVAAGIAVAVLRYRLFEIDRIVSRSVTYALVLAVLAGVYVGVFAALANLIPSRYGQVGVAATTLLVSIVAVPLTRRVRRVVDRRFDRSRFDAERVAGAFAARLRARPERGDVPSDLLEIVQRTVAPAHAGVWLLSSDDSV
jgi:hypothetical protein